jgi:hypothetical protein
MDCKSASTPWLETNDRLALTVASWHGTKRMAINDFHRQPDSAITVAPLIE